MMSKVIDVAPCELFGGCELIIEIWGRVRLLAAAA